jgi:hypothetical protein
MCFENASNEIILRVLPRPGASTRRPPKNLGGGSLCSRLVTMLVYLKALLGHDLLNNKQKRHGYRVRPVASVKRVHMSFSSVPMAQPCSRRIMNVKACFWCLGK